MNWKPIENAPGYFVSRFGDVYSTGRGTDNGGERHYSNGRQYSKESKKYVCTVVMAIAICLCVLHQPARSQAWPSSWLPGYQFTEHADTYLASQKEAGVDLYIKPVDLIDIRIDPGPQPTPAPKVDPRKATPKDYPTLYEKGREKGTVVIFGAPWCGWCKTQLNVIPDGYRVLYVDVENKTGPKWRALMTKWEVVHKVRGKEAPTFPTCVVAVGGIPVDHWYGFKPFATIKTRIEKAKDEAKNNVDNGNGGYRGNGGRPFKRPSRRRHRAKYGRWS